MLEHMLTKKRLDALDQSVRFISKVVRSVYLRLPPFTEGQLIEHEEEEEIQFENERGASLEQLAQLTTITFTQVQELEQGQEGPVRGRTATAHDASSCVDSRCAVCLEGYSWTNNVSKLPCGHVFHSMCVFNWLSTRVTCPVCRRRLDLVENG